MVITAQEAWVQRSAGRSIEVPAYLREWWKNRVSGA